MHINDPFLKDVQYIQKINQSYMILHIEIMQLPMIILLLSPVGDSFHSDYMQLYGMSKLHYIEIFQKYIKRGIHNEFFNIDGPFRELKFDLTIMVLGLL